MAVAVFVDCFHRLGICVLAVRRAANYVIRHKARGSSLIHHDGILSLLAGSKAELKRAESLAYRRADCISSIGHGASARRRGHIAVLETLLRVINRFAKVISPEGATADPILERIFRQITLFRLYEGPKEVNRYRFASTKRWPTEKGLDA